MWAKLLKMLALTKGNSGDGTKKVIRGIVIIVLSPIIAIVLLIGGIFSSGIDFNQRVITDLYSNKPITDLSGEQMEHVQEIQRGLQLIDKQISITNDTFNNGATLNDYMVKGYFIAIMLSKESIKLDEEKAKLWVKSFTVEETENDQINVYPTSVTSIIYEQLNKNLQLSFSEEVKELMSNVYGELIGNKGGNVTTLSKEEIDKLLKNLPIDTSELRKKIIIQGADAVGKIPYYWGGYATVPGYDGNEFGKVITADENGRNKKGLDCSHFVDWVYWTVMDNNLGNTNTTGQIKMCKEISVSELKVGDLAFLMDKNGNTTHVGIYAGKNQDGELVWIHENAQDNNVAINTVNYWSGYYRLNFMEGK